MNRAPELTESEIADMQAWSESILDAFGVCTRCGAKHEPPRGDGCLFADEHMAHADTIPAPRAEAAE